ncbi:MAG: hypothetical protein ACM3RP_06955 [Chitinophagales bacterium]
MPLYDQDGRLRILFADAYGTLLRQGRITSAQAEAVQDLVDRLEELPPADLIARLRALFPEWKGQPQAGEGPAPAGPGRPA